MAGDITLPVTEEGDITLRISDNLDTDAIHDNVAGEISSVTEKTSPNDDDLILIEDSASGNAKKKMKISNLLESALGVSSVNGETGDVVLSTGDLTEDTDKNYVTDAEKVVVGNTSGTNTGDQDLSNLALKSNVLELDNTTSFIPDADYEPATKKYVDDNIGDGDVTGPVSSVNENISIFDGVSGKLIKDSSVNISDVNSNTTHRDSDGKDHSDVVLNNTHRGLVTGNPHNVTLADVGGTTDHTALSNIGTKTHPQIDTHIDNMSNPHGVLATQLSDFDTEVANNPDVAANTIHRSSDGKNHSDVVLNNTHRISDGKDHSDVVLNNTHRTSNGVDHTYIDQDVTSGSSPNLDGANITGIDYENVEIAQLGTPTYDNVKDFINIAQSAGKISGWDVSDGGSGTLNVTSGTGYIRSTDSQIGEIISFDLGPTSGISLIDNSNNWIYVDYNSGSPQFAVTADLADIDFNTKILIGQAYREGLTVTAIDAGPAAYDVAYRTARRAFEIYRVSRADGLVLGEEGTRNMSMTAGSTFYGTTKQIYTALDTSISDTFTYHYHTSGAWTTSTGNTQIDNVYYDNGTDLTELGVAKFGVHWVYLGFDNKFHVIYGDESYSLTDAEASQEPSTPDFVSTFAFLIGRIIILKNASSFTETSSAFDTTFTSQTAADHSELSNLQGGTTGEYYHLTSAEYSNIGDATSIQSVTVDDTDIGDGKILTYNATSGNLEYEDVGGTGTVTSVAAGDGLDFSAITASGNVTMGTPSTLTGSTANAVTTTSHTHLITTGISNDDIVEIDSASVIDNDYAKFTANGLEGRTYAELRTDINVEDGAEANNISDVNATDLTDGSTTTLHNHSAPSIAHSATTGRTANDHHNESHTIASHSDTTATGAELNTLTGGGDTTLHDHDGISENTSARHTQGTDTTLGSGAVAEDHGTASTDQIINVSYGTSATPPTASTTTEGSLYVQYTA